MIVMANATRAFRMGDFLLFGVILACSIVIFLSLVAMKTVKSLFLAGNLFLTAYYVCLAIASFRNGGTISNIQYNFAVMIILGYLLCGFKNGAVWGFISITTIITFKIMAAQGFVFLPPQEDDPFINLFVVLVVSYFLVMAYEMSAVSNLTTLADEKNRTKEAARKLKELLSNTKAVMSAVANGDLTKRITVEAEGELRELSSSVNGTLNMLGQTINHVYVSAQQIESGTTQVSDAA